MIGYWAIGAGDSKEILVNPKTGCSRKFFLPENDFKSYSAKLLMPTDPTMMWNWDLKFVKLPWLNEPNKLPKSFWMCHKKIHQEYPQIGKSYIGKIKIYLNDAKPKILLSTENWSLGR